MESEAAVGLFLAARAVPGGRVVDALDMAHHKSRGRLPHSGDRGGDGGDHLGAYAFAGCGSRISHRRRGYDGSGGLGLFRLLFAGGPVGDERKHLDKNDQDNQAEKHNQKADHHNAKAEDQVLHEYPFLSALHGQVVVLLGRVGIALGGKHFQGGNEHGAGLGGIDDVVHHAVLGGVDRAGHLFDILGGILGTGFLHGQGLVGLDLVSIEQIDKEKTSRSFDDYRVVIDRENCPDSVEIIELI